MIPLSSLLRRHVPIGDITPLNIIELEPFIVGFLTIAKVGIARDRTQVFNLIATRLEEVGLAE